MENTNNKSKPVKKIRIFKELKAWGKGHKLLNGLIKGSIKHNHA